MAGHYLTTIFTDTTRALQVRDGSRVSYARMESDAAGGIDILADEELDFITARDSFYMASVTARGWPYMQHRGGPPGFLKHMSANRLGFADYRGNRQFVSVANIASDARVSLFLVDYPNRQRLKLIGRATVITVEEDAVLVSQLMPAGYKAVAQRAFLIDIEGFDWNCPQHITPRFNAAEIEAVMAPLNMELEQLRAEVASLRAMLDAKDSAR